jgi:SAM-dependent methyltransferase
MFHREVGRTNISRNERVVAAAWDKNSCDWIAYVRSGRDVLRELLHDPTFFDVFLSDLASLKVLDLGCGDGHSTRLLARRGVRMTGIDISRRLIGSAKLTENAKPLGIEYHVCSFTSIGLFANESFDAAISTMALMNSPNLKKAANSAFRILRPGGTFFFSVLHPCFWTRTSRWIGEDAVRKEGLLVSNYWSNQPYIEKSYFNLGSESDTSPFLIPRFPYLLEDYINGMAEAGFRITRMLEPRPTAKAAMKYPSLLGSLRVHVPIFLYLAGTKA